MDTEERNEQVYTLPVTEAETAVLLLALSDYIEDNPMNTSTAERLHKKTELLNRCIRKEKELHDARQNLLDYTGHDFFDDT